MSQALQWRRRAARQAGSGASSKASRKVYDAVATPGSRPVPVVCRKAGRGLGSDWSAVSKPLFESRFARACFPFSGRCRLHDGAAGRCPTGCPARCRTGYRRARPAAALAARRAGLWFGRNRADAVDGRRLRPGRGRAGRRRGLPAIPPVRQPLGQSFRTRRDLARARRQCVEPGVGLARRRAAGRSVLRLYPVQRTRRRSPGGRADHARRRGWRIRRRSGRGHDRIGQCDQARPPAAGRFGVLRQRPGGRGIRQRLA